MGWVAPLPAVPRRLWLAGIGWVLCAVNLCWRQEIWANTPRASAVLQCSLWLLTLALLPQLALLGWQWLQRWALPHWLQVLAAMAYIGAVGVLVLLWLVVFIGGMVLFA
ncbi:hypothetical protein GCM10023185_22020 [Hymenobacter saemangeumensis]|uniref:Uncharacterized protein n=1 Tax=Hymenobacter saemangeumensis TaxID=1084522 RepID=A0ABP8IFF7_9BACT